MEKTKNNLEKFGKSLDERKEKKLQKLCSVRCKVEELLAAIGECTITTDLWISSHQQHS